MDREQIQNRTLRNITAAQRWLSEKTSEARREEFFGELVVRLKFEDGQCVLGEQTVVVRTK